jgi:cytoskeletal protein CcmA (bactofilin family)
MSIYPSPKLHNGSLNTIFNNTDYIKVASSGGGGSTIAQTDARYLKNSGVVVSSANTTFNGTLNVASLATVDGLVAGDIDASNINISSLATVDSLVSGDISASNINISSLATVDSLVSGDISASNINISSLATVDSLVSGDISASNINVSGSATVDTLDANLLTAGNVSTTNITSSTLGSFNDINVSGLLSADSLKATTSLEAETITASLATFDTLDANLLKAKQSTDTLSSDIFRSDQVYNFSNGMVYSIISDATTVNSVSFINIPTTTNQSYIFTFILRPTAVDSPYYIKSSTNAINVNGVSVPLYGLQNVSLPSAYTYLVQQITIIYNLYASEPKFIGITSISAY